MKNRMMFRQGDILVVEISESIPSEAKIEPRDDQNRIVLALGEQTNHAHAIHSKAATLYAVNKNLRLLKTEDEVELVHEEHSTINLSAKKTFQIIRQVEYVEGKIVQVAD